jgi:hypothetical protein
MPAAAVGGCLQRLFGNPESHYADDKRNNKQKKPKPHSPEPDGAN